MDDLTLRYFVGDVSDVDNPRKFAVVALVEFNLCTIHKVPTLVGHKLHIQSFIISNCKMSRYKNRSRITIQTYRSEMEFRQFW